MIGPASALLCPGCFTALPSSHLNSADFVRCPLCQANVQAAVFPAAYRDPGPGTAGERILVAGESSCFYHDQKKAVVPCDTCGRFLCALCDVDLGGKHVCPQCLESGREKGSLTQLETRRITYDNAALILALGPVVVFFFWAFTLLTAPVALALGIIAYFKPNSILGFSRLKALTAIVLAVLQITAWALLFLGMLKPLLA